MSDGRTGSQYFTNTDIADAKRKVAKDKARERKLAAKKVKEKKENK